MGERYSQLTFTLCCYISLLSCVLSAVIPSPSSTTVENSTLKSDQELSPIITFPNGNQLQGTVGISRGSRQFYEYRGIPFAKAPVGKLRFESPEELTEEEEEWQGLKLANNFGPKCIQYDRVFHTVIGQEDCLYLNVFVPKIENQNATTLPVMVWLHGGFFLYGSSNSFGPHYFMDQDVILVTTNYRLASIGFLNTEDGIVRGNMGLKDQNMALQWVQKNIQQFQGDPNRVTLFGESAGAAAVHFHLLSPRSPGLFHSAISQSGSAIKLFSLAMNPRKQALRLASKVNCSRGNDTKEMVNCLKSLDAAIIVAIHKEEMNPLVDPIKIFAPSVEVGDPNDPNTFLAEHPYKILEEGRAYRVPYITGLNSEEGLYLNGRIMNNPRLIKLIETRWDDISAQFLQYNASNKEITEKIKQFYNLNSATTAVQENTLTAALENETSKPLLVLDFNYFEEFHKLTNIFSDRMYNTATRESVRLQAQYSPVYTYYNSYQGEWCFVTTFVPDDEDASCDQPPSRYTSPWWKENIELKSRPNYGVSHADELPFFFNYTGAREINSTCADYQISLDLVKLWVDFAYNSTNMTFRGSQWKPVDPKAPTMKYLSITNDIQHSAHHSTCGGEGETKATPNQSNHSLLIDEPILERIKFWESLKLPTYGLDFDNGLNLDVDHLLLLDNIKVKLPTAEILKLEFELDELEPNALLSSTMNLIDTKSNIL